MKLALARLGAVLALVPAACASDAVAPERSGEATIDWRDIATEHDRSRLRGWRSAWSRALDRAVAGGHAEAIAGEGPLLDPDSAIDWQDPPPGLYRCRTIKLGARSAGMLDFVAYPPFECRIRQEEGMTSFAKVGGSQRPIGLLFPYGEERMVFLGTLQLGDETRALQYGRDRERDLVALVERIDERRWRLVFPSPHFESLLDVVELTPETP